MKMFDEGLEELLDQAYQAIPDKCHLSIDKLKNRQDKLPIEEEKYLVNLSQKRQEEFVGGRNIARFALHSLGYENSYPIILKHDDGSPCWPTDIVGSISHKLNLVGAFVGYKKLHQSVGFDIEKVEHLDPSTWKYFSSIEEIKVAKKLSLDESIYANMLFSIKESMFKCFYPLYNHNSPQMLLLKPEVRTSNQGFISNFKHLDTVCTVRTFMDSNLTLSLACAHNAH